MREKEREGERERARERETSRKEREESKPSIGASAIRALKKKNSTPTFEEERERGSRAR